MKNFLGSGMVKGVFISGFSLFAGVIIVYLTAYFNGFSLIKAQTYAFTAWIIGHIILAFVSRSEKEPLYSIGMNTNKLMNIWALAVIGFLVLINMVPVVSSQLKVTPLKLSEFAMILLTTLACISWRELIKIVKFSKIEKTKISF